METNQEYYPFTDSVYDHDKEIEKLGFNKVGVFETRTLLTKTIYPESKKILTALLHIEHNNRLFSGGFYDLCSPYQITLEVQTTLNHMIRRLTWDTFPGYRTPDKDEFIKQVESIQSEAMTLIDYFTKNGPGKA